ncbi:MAG TPA: leucine--tRNA ligase [Candidatus Faecimonas gallistercoris]|nr:leucine--tRNA ligase [Candidatus Faecimonas gallistercoris]
MNKFNEIEKKWQSYWQEHHCFKAVTGDKSKTPYYILVEFPYPSGAGLHVGHVRSYTAQDVLARVKRMQGYNVLFPMGWDAFGAPAEQYAIKNHIHPKDAVKENIHTFKGQMQSLGFSFDWDREFSTTDPEYYKWTQWQFLQFYKHGMAYKAKKDVNWCPTCKSVLSNEDAAGGVCERCGSKVVQKEKEQWMLRMSDYAEDLLKGLDDTHFADRVKLGQINWIGKSTGAEVDFTVQETGDKLTVYTTRCDTLFGVTFMVLAPEHPILEKLSSLITNMDEVKKYQEFAKTKSAFERTEVNKDKTGVKLEGITVINPITEKAVEVFISDYVMMGYGTGAIMAVPAHDERDYEFAKKFNIPIVQVIEGGDLSKGAYTGDGKMINSGFLNGFTNKKDSIQRMLEYLKEKELGREKVNYRLQDWIFSRQRFWGEPIPMIYCEKCGWQPMKEEDLPLLLPDVAEYEPTDTGESPLAKITDWVNTTCPCCGGPAKRETDTMPNWAGSSWYFLRFMDAHNDKEFASMDALKYWQKVNWYNGGMEHTARHLLYARFWVQFLYNIGLVPNKEMIDVRVSHGMVLGPDNQKMSKSKGNVINPDDIVKEYGADTLRTYEMFMGDYQQDAPWSTESLRGCKRFLDKVERLASKVVDKDGYSDSLAVIQNKTIKAIDDDLSRMSYNTYISALMILTNAYDDMNSITKEDYRLLLILLNPVAPHMTEELNEQLGYEPICYAEWPCYDEKYLVEKEKEIAVQVNGKVRATIMISIDDSEEVIKEKALSADNVKRHIDGKEIVKVIVIKGKIVNIVVK